VLLSKAFPVASLTTACPGTTLRTADGRLSTAMVLSVASSSASCSRISAQKSPTGCENRYFKSKQNSVERVTGGTKDTLKRVNSLFDNLSKREEENRNYLQWWSKWISEL
jgi:hypothetical protein